MYPIIGDRYKCSICPDFDLCTACEPKHDHPLIKYKKCSKAHANASFDGLGEIFGKNEEEKDEFFDIYDDEAKVVSDSDAVIDCICGSKMELVRARDAYTHCNTVFCDICNVQLFNENVWHCPLGYDDAHHANGYDVCTQCALKKKKSVEKEEDVQSQSEESAVIVEKIEDFEKEQSVEPEEVFEFAAQLQQIKEIMALESEDRDEAIKGMLVEAKGDISKVVPLLF